MNFDCFVSKPLGLSQSSVKLAILSQNQEYWPVRRGHSSASHVTFWPARRGHARLLRAFRPDKSRQTDRTLQRLQARQEGSIRVVTSRRHERRSLPRWSETRNSSLWSE